MRDIKTKEEFDVTCTWSEMQDLLKENPNLIQKLSTPKIISGRMGGMKVPDGFTDLKKQIKKNSGRGNTIKT
jgi:hypothetical protein